MTALKALALVAFLLVPGWLAVSLLEGRRGGGGAGEKGARGGTGEEPARGVGLKGGEKLFLAAALGTGIVSVCALALALASAYRLWSLLLLVALACAPMAVLGRDRLAWPLRVGGKQFLLCLALVAAVMALSSPPGRTVFGWSDVGVYADIAANIDRAGSIRMESSTVREVAPERRGLVYKEQDDPSQRFLAYDNKALLITDFESGTVVPIFYWLWPSFMAVFASFLGRGLLFWAVTAMAVIGLCGLWLLSLRLLGSRWGIAAVVLGALSPLYVYFSRYCTSEMMNMGVFLAASLCLTAYLEHAGKEVGRTSRNLARASAFLFTLGFLCRIDFLLVLAPLALFYLFKRAYGGLDAADWWFCSLTLAGAAAATLVGMRFSAPYFFSVFTYLARNLRRGILVAAAGAVVVVAAFVFAPRLKGVLRRVARLRKVLLVVLWLSLSGFFIYLYFVRPGRADSIVPYGVISSTRGSSYVNETMVRWGWYLSVPGLALAFIGYALWFSRRRETSRLPVAMMGLALTIGYGFDMRCTPLHIIAMRRLVPVIFPVAAVMAAYALAMLAEAGKRLGGARRWGEIAGRLAAGALLLYLTLYAAGASVPIFGLEEGGNQLELCGEIAGSVDAGGVVLMDFHLGDHFGPPLRGFYGLENAWLMENASLSGKDFSALLSDLGFPGREVYLLWRPGMSGYHVPVADGLGVEEVASYVSWEEALEKSFEKRPASRRYTSEEILLFRFVETGGAT